ncbi:preprotein translocase subunit SecY [Paracrocinitomix mangrovi]|uniref:preprotein translocase subunit SecY n=1 Tax=Paracrocinitomix mangrovi TaxID=2862509 RepID=UPI001C8EC97E|nr:preprotein translocase subunit SecY [Paracrocinitomix mangrovi]UKN03163.1 preprotein translocase subunit SecY [Paracrocinitomix mangrovi]
MKKFIDTLKNIWKVEELRNRILLTLGLILVYRLGSFIVLPGVDQGQLAAGSSGGGLVALLDLFAGGAFSKASVMALGIMPYISASIIMQLLGMAVPVVQKLQKEGESGRRKINGYTRILTILICAFQGPSYLQMYVISANGVVDPDMMWWISSIMLLVAGTMFAMWLGERITDKGVGNGISLLITVGILARFPQSVFTEFLARNSGSGGIFMFIVEMLVFFAIIIVTVLIVQGVRRVPINYAKRVAGQGNVAEASQRSYIPLKVNAAGVMPIIFAQAIMTVPTMIQSDSVILQELQNYRGFWYNFVFALMIIIFTYFYTAITINPKQIADDLKRSGGFVPGIKPGTETADFIDTILSRITFPGSFFLALIAIIPAFAMLFGINDGFAMFMGGTSMLIMVGVVLDTLQQIETYLLNRHYDGLMEGGRIRGRRGANEFSGI